MAWRITNIVNRLLAEKGRGCGSVLAFDAVFTPRQYRLVPVYSKVKLSSFHDCQSLKIQDDFFIDLHIEGQKMEGNLSLLLLLCAQWNNNACIQHLLEKSRAAGVRPSCYTMERILNAHIRRKQLNTSVTLYGTIKREYSQNSLEASTVLPLCVMLIESGKGLEAVQILKEFVEKEEITNVSPKRTSEVTKAVLNKATELEGYEITKRLFDLMLLGGLLDPGPQEVAPLLQCKLNTGDLQGTVEVAEYIYYKFNTLPKRMEALIRLIKYNKCTAKDLITVLESDGSKTLKDTNLLGRMYDIIQKCYGRVQAQHDLLFACLESGCPEGAYVVLQTLADDVDERQLVKMCKLYAKNEREAALEHLLDALKGITNINRPKIYEILLDAYTLSNKNMGEKALVLESSMREEGLTLSPTINSKLVALLKTCNVKVPFHLQ